MPGNDKWFDTLKSLQDTITEILNIPDPDGDRHYIDVDLSKREVKLPSSYYADFLDVQNDHLATEIWFRMDRYFDDVDLSKTTCVIEYINAAGEGRICPVLSIDTTTFNGQLCVCWQVGREATKQAGKIKFVLHFYNIVQNSNGDFVYSYSLSTRPCEATILKSLDKTVSLDKAYDYSAEIMNEIYGRLSAVEQKAVLWRDLED